MTVYVECSVCGQDIGKLGIGRHWNTHRREFRELVGRRAESNDEIRRVIGGDTAVELRKLGIESPQKTLEEAVSG